jgi:hypothetical protein
VTPEAPLNVVMNAQTSTAATAVSGGLTAALYYWTILAT